MTRFQSRHNLTAALRDLSLPLLLSHDLNDHESPNIVTVTQENSEQRTPCVLVLDVSTSMAGEKIAQLDQSCRNLVEDLKRDPVAAARVEIAVVTFDEVVRLVRDFTPAREFTPIHLATGGGTSLAEAAILSLALAMRQEDHYERHSLDRTTPHIFQFTDGEPTSTKRAIEHAKELIREFERSHQIAYYAVGTVGADFDFLTEFSVRTPIRIPDWDFPSFFRGLSRSLRSMSRLCPGEEPTFLNPFDQGVRRLAKDRP